MKSLFGDMFDFNHDGELDTFERAMELEFWEDLGRKTEPADDEDETELEMSGLDPLELERSGLDPIELEFMDPDERREALEDAGLDPEEYDF